MGNWDRKLKVINKPLNAQTGKMQESASQAIYAPNADSNMVAPYSGNGGMIGITETPAYNSAYILLGLRCQF